MGKKIRTRVDLARAWRSLAVAACLAVLCGLVGKQLVAQQNDEWTWRRTNRGWEYAHSIPMATQPSTPTATQRGRPETSLAVQQYHIALPLALFSFIVSFSYWSLREVPNRGILRRLGAAPPCN